MQIFRRPIAAYGTFRASSLPISRRYIAAGFRHQRFSNATSLLDNMSKIDFSERQRAWWKGCVVYQVRCTVPRLVFGLRLRLTWNRSTQLRFKIPMMMVLGMSTELRADWTTSRTLAVRMPLRETPKLLANVSQSM